MFNSTVAWDVTNGSTPFLTPLEKKYNPAIEKNKLTIVSLKSADIESITEKSKQKTGWTSADFESKLTQPQKDNTVLFDLLPAHRAHKLDLLLAGLYPWLQIPPP